jgi:hypothetical protein
VMSIELWLQSLASHHARSGSALPMSLGVVDGEGRDHVLHMFYTVQYILYSILIVLIYSIMYRIYYIYIPYIQLYIHWNPYIYNVIMRIGSKRTQSRSPFGTSHMSWDPNVFFPDIPALQVSRFLWTCILR